MYVNRKNRDAFRYRYVAAHWAHTHSAGACSCGPKVLVKVEIHRAVRTDGRTVLRRVDAMLDIVTTNRPC